MQVNFDFEVYSDLSIKAVPLDVYAAHPSTKIILNAYSFDDGPVKVWQYGQPKCAEFGKAIRDPRNTLVAWNINYERTVLAGKGLPTPIQRWIDPMAHARYAGLPGKLKDCARIPMIGVPTEEKTKNETLLINRFCTPDAKGRTLERLIDEYRDDWTLFIDYCRKDVLTMRHVHNWLVQRFPFPDRERRIWELDQTINQRGLPVDVAMAKVADRETARLIGAGQNTLKEITGLENPNSIMQLLPWLQERGYKYDTLPKELVAQALDDLQNPDTNPDPGSIDILKLTRVKALQAALEVRAQVSKSSVKKFAKFVKATSPDGRARNQFVYAGAHTLRWSGRDIQPHNLPRKKTNQETLKTLLEMAA